MKIVLAILFSLSLLSGKGQSVLAIKGIPVADTIGTGGDTTTPTSRSHLLFQSAFSRPLAPVGGWPQWLTAAIGVDWTHFIPQGSEAHGVTQSNDHLRETAETYVMKNYLNKTEDLLSNGARAELLWGTWEGAVERWYGTSIYIPSDYAFDPFPESVVQWHHDDSNFSPPLALYLGNGYWQMDRIQTYGGPESQTALIPYTVGAWTDVVFHIKWSTVKGTALTELWLNGTNVWNNDSDPNQFTIGGTPLDNLFRIGIYKWVYYNALGASPRTLYYSTTRIGDELATYKDVAPGNY